MTLVALPPSITINRIIIGKLVASFAVCLFSVFRHGRLPSESIFLYGNWLQVVRVYATSNSTKMVYDKFFGY